ETMRFQEMDEISRRFQSLKNQAYEAQQNLAKTLASFDSSEVHDTLLPDELEDEFLSPQMSMEDAASLATNLVEQFASVLEGYRQLIDTLDRELTDVADQLQGELDELQLLTGGKIREVAEAKALYEQKLAEPE